MVVTPYYYRPTQAGIVEYFRRLGDKVDGDLVLYEIPYRTGVSLPAGDRRSDRRAHAHRRDEGV